MTGCEQRRILVVVKTYPNPSQAYGETVCCAGVDLDTRRWVRIYPIEIRCRARAVVYGSIVMESSSARISALSAREDLGDRLASITRRLPSTSRIQNSSIMPT
jgi:hypothetical protein